MKFKLEEIAKYDVVIITHTRYVMLCENEIERKAICENRHTLIIDEKIEFPTYSYSEREYRELLNITPPQHHELIVDFNIIVNDEAVELTKHVRKNVIATYKSIFPYEEFIDELEKIINNIKILKNREIGRKILKSLKHILSGVKCLYTDGKISTIDRNHKLFTLENNIILDANGQLDKVYSKKINSIFVANRQSKIISHHDSTIQYIKFNTSKGSINRNEEEYFQRIIEMIKQNHNEFDKSLIVLQKKFIIDSYGNEQSFLKHLREEGIKDLFIGSEDEDGNNSYNNESYAVNWFGNIIGKNDWKDFTNCWIVGSPLYPMDTYILNLWHYSGRDNWKIPYTKINKDRVFQFKNTDLENIRKGFIVGEIYQTIKRIQRNHAPNAKFFIVNNDDKVFDIVTQQLTNIKVEEMIDLGILTAAERKRREDQKAKKTDKTTAIIDIILKRTAGEYAKSEIVEEAGIKAGKLSRYLNEKMDIVIQHKNDFCINNKTITRF